jgi:exosortase/archaeosortase family protein
MIATKKTSLVNEKQVWIYLAKFAGIFCLLYFGTLAVIGLAAYGGLYSPFVDKYLDYVSWIKVSLIQATALILSFFHIQTHTEPGFMLRYEQGRAVIIAMSCVGYGVYSFWIAFVAANKGKFVKKLIWIFFGVFALWFINVLRITLFLTAINKGWPMPLGIDHHTWFNIFAYALIFLMIWGYDRSFKKGKAELIDN